MNTDSTAEKKSNAILNMNVTRMIIGLTEIGNLDIEDFDINYNITRNIANLNDIEKAYSKSLTALQKKYVKKDEKGNLTIQNNFFVFENDENKKSYTDELEKLNETIVDETKVKIYKLKTSELKKIKGLKGTTMAKCHELIEDDIATT